MKIYTAAVSVFATSLFAAFLLLTTGCEISDGDETVREVSISISGSYRNAGGIPERQSGATITQLTLSQNGDQLTAIDNEGTRWTGTIGRATNALATVNLRGLTTTGVEVVITGTINIEGTTATLTGLWVEPALTAEVNATASVAGSPTPTPTPAGTPSATVTPTPTPIP
jgi:hypothetical protein